jgi:DNA-binding MarR family transcriptional regulator
MHQDDPVSRFLQAYSRFIQQLWDAGRRLNRKYDISGGQVGVLRYIEFRGPCSLGDIRRVTGGHLSALGQKVDRLEAAGWIERRRNPTDRRKLEIRLTAKARRMLKREPLVGPARVIHEMKGMTRARARRMAEAMELVSAVMVGPGPAEGKS